MRRWHLSIFSFLTLILIPGFSVAQNSIRNDSTIRVATITQNWKDKSYYLPQRATNTVIIKFKEEHRFAFSDYGRYKEFHDYLTSLNCFEKNKAFPGSKKPEKEYDHLNRKLADLSNIYVLRYSNNISIDEVITHLKRMNYFEYVEPKYIYRSQYLPNDPQVDPATGLQYFYIYQMQVFEAWDIEQGDPSVVVGIVDTGMDLTHPELSNHVTGWDIADGDADVANAGNGHGTTVSGCASATIDNNEGGVGISFNSPFMPIKAAPDAAAGSINAGYEGIYYAVDNGCSIVNLSWGGPGTYSQVEQDAIDYAVINNDVVVTAAAGNTDADLVFYPAAYNGVLSAAAIYEQIVDNDTVIYKTFFGTYNYGVDISAQGIYYLAPLAGGGYVGATGSSFSSPIVAGCAALVRSYYGSSLNAIQVGELLRVTAEKFDTLPENALYFEKLGKGRVNPYLALTNVTSPSVRFSNLKTTGFHNTTQYFFEGDTISARMDFWNWLRTTNDLYINISSPNPHVVIIDSLMHVGVLDSMTGTNNNSRPFRFYLNSQADTNEVVWIRVGYYDTTKAYYDYQYFKILVNPTYLDIDTNLTRLTITSIGRFGFQDPPTDEQGNGFQYPDNNPLLFEGGLLIGTDATHVSDCVRGMFGSMESEFKILSPARYVSDANSPKDQEARAVFNDSLALLPIGVKVEQRSYAWHDSPDDHYIIMEYIITNQNSTQIDTLDVALFADWDIGNYSKNRTDYDYGRAMSYVYELPVKDTYVGVSLLTKNDPICYAMDNGTVPGNNVNPSGNWSTSSKFNTLSHGIARTQAGLISSGGFDVSHLVGGTLYNIAPGEKKVIAFAIIAGGSLPAIQTSRDKALIRFNNIHTSVPPVLDEQSDCSNGNYSVTLTAANSTNFNFYSDVSMSTLLTHGSSYSEDPVTTRDTIVITNADSLYESAPMVYIFDPANKTQASFSYAPAQPYLNTDPNVTFLNTSLHYDSLQWNFGDGSIAKTLVSSNTVHSYTMPGQYNVELIAYGAGCSDTLTKTINIKGDAGIRVYPVPSSSVLNIDVFLEEDVKYDIQVYNSLGQLVYSSNDRSLSEGTLELNINSWSAGIYHVEVIAGKTKLKAKAIKW